MENTFLDITLKNIEIKASNKSITTLTLPSYLSVIKYYSGLFCLMKAFRKIELAMANLERLAILFVE